MINELLKSALSTLPKRDLAHSFVDYLFDSYENYEQSQEEAKERNAELEKELAEVLKKLEKKSNLSKGK